MGSIVGGITGAIGGMISGDAAAGAANEQADYLRNLSAEQRKNITDAAAAAAARGQFKPVTVTSMFGTPQYTYDDTGRLTGVSSQAVPWLQDIISRQTGLAGQYSGLTESALSAAPTYARGAELAAGGAERMYGLAGQALPSTYDTSAATQDYYNKLQALVAPERERQLASTRQGLFNRGRQGLAIGATQAGGELATNPEMAAYYNAIAKQDQEMALAADERARANLQQDITTAGKLYSGGAGMFTEGGNLQNQLYRNVAASQAPFATGMQSLTGLEQTAYTPVTQGFGYAGSVVPAEQWAGQIGLTGATSAANIATSLAPQIANYQYQHSSYSPWGSLLQGVGGALGQSSSPNWGSLFGSSGPTGPQMSNAAYYGQDAYAARLNALEGF